jgi:hypothetical protein
MKHNLIAPLRSIPPIRRTFAAISIALSLVFALAAFGSSPVRTAWTYQGQLQRSGSAYNGTCDFQLSLWDALSSGTQQSGTLTATGVNVVNGLFTVEIDFGDEFQGDARWLGTSVQCSGDGGFTPLNPRQPIFATPYALSLRPGARISSVTGPLSIAGPLTATTNASLGTAITGTGRTGVSGNSDLSSDSIGVLGQAGGTNSVGVYGQSGGTNSAGVFGTTSIAFGVWGKSAGSGTAIYGQNTSSGLAGRFTGSVVVEGNLIVQGSLFKNAGSFRIDHPLDPANKFLSHSFVESPDMKNIYDGNITTDASGSATVTLPDYFAALNRDYRYQLTVLGQFAQAIVFREIAGNSFEIHTDKPGVKVSWQVTGIRQDAYAKEHPIVVEEFKPADQKGLYLYPAGFGASEEKGIGHPSRPTTAPGAQEASAAGPSSQASK